MNFQRARLEQILLLVALLLALGLRLYRLGVTPLSDIEAYAALPAWQASQANGISASLDLGAQPLYTLLTSGLFELFQSSNFLARLLPALAGTLLILAPYLMRRQIGRIAAFILMFGLAFDPGMVTVSRQAGSLMLALAFSLLAIGFWLNRSAAWAGIFAGLALLSGPSLISGLIPLGLAWLITRFVLSKPVSEEGLEGESAVETGQLPLDPEAVQPPSIQNQIRTALLAMGITMLLAGTLFFRSPQGISAWLEMIPLYLRGWTGSLEVPALRLPATLIFYQPLALLFALVGVLFGLTQRNLRMVLFLTLWLVIALVLGMLYPARQVANLVWMLAPLWGLAAIELKRYLPDRETHPTSLALALLVLILMGLFWFSLASISRTIPTTDLAPLTSRLLIFLGILALVLLSTALVFMGWSWKAARNGLVWGLLAGLSIYLISVMWGAAQLRFNQPQELWGLPPATGQADLLQVTLDELSLWQNGALNTLDVQSTVDTPSLRWFLRSNPQVRYVPQIPNGQQPSILITEKGSEAPALETAYRGQDFVWSVNPGWSGALPPDLLAWFTFRRAPLQLESIIVWARNDLFPGQPAQVQPGSSVIP